MAPNQAMAEALRLTRAGKLGEATALLRNGLGAAIRSTQAAKDQVIDLIPQAVEPSAARRAPAQSQPQSRPKTGTGSFERREHVGASGSIGYVLYRPAQASPGMPLVVMLHGCTQSPEDFARGTAMNELAEELGFLVAYPRQTQAANQQKCWNWFRPSDQARGRGEPALIAGLTRDIVAAEHVDAGRIYVAGLSAGGAAAAIMADAYPDVFAAVGIHSGLACGAARDMAGALSAMQRGGAGKAARKVGTGRFVPVITFHGDRDHTVNEVNARDIVRAATLATGAPVTVEVEQGTVAGRHYTREVSRNAAGQALIEQWTIAGAGHAWSGGNPAGSYADAAGPDASRAMLRFFLDHRSDGA
jgi:poly(hydroxyalkanoate) depolymerase family esterase